MVLEKPELALSFNSPAFRLHRIVSSMIAALATRHGSLAASSDRGSLGY
jgi:hypothetical protein